jgi:threonine dehydrogenase-like Zn-dependent dehydrogenase
MVATASGGKIDLTPLWFRELTVLGIFGRQTENYDGRRINTNSLVHEFMLTGKLPVEQMLTHTFRLEEYREAFNVAMNKGEHQSVKVAFDFR